MLRWALVWLAILLQPWKWRRAYVLTLRWWHIHRRLKEHQRLSLRTLLNEGGPSDA